MKSKQIKDLSTAIETNPNVADAIAKKHAHSGSTNKVPRYNGAGNYADSQITDNGSNIAVGDAPIDASVLFYIKKAISTLLKLENTKTDGATTVLEILSNKYSEHINTALRLGASGSLEGNIALEIINGKVIVGTGFADDSAAFQIESTGAGILIPRMTSAQRNAILFPANGLIVYDVTVNDVVVNTGTPTVPVWIGLKALGISGTINANNIPKALNSSELTPSQINDNGSNVAINDGHEVDTRFNVKGSSTQNTAIKGNAIATNEDCSGVDGISDGLNPANVNTGTNGYAKFGQKNVGARGRTGANFPNLNTGKNYGGTFIAGNEGGSSGVNVGATAQATESNSNDNIGLEIIVRNPGTGASRVMKVDTGSDNTGKSFKIIDANGNVALVKFTETALSVSAGEIAIFDANGNIVSDSNLFYNSTTNELIINDADGYVGFAPGLFSLSENNNDTIFQQLVYSNNATHTNTQAYWRSGGTNSALTNILINFLLFSREMYSYNGSFFVQCFLETIKATQNHSSTNHGIEWSIETISNETAGVLKKRIGVDGDGHTRVKNGNLRVDDGQIGFKTYTNAISTSTARTIDFNNANTQEIDLDTATGNVTITFSNMIEGTPYLLNVIQGATPREITFAQVVRWSGGASGKPIFANLTNNQETLISIVYLNGKFIASAVVNHS
jgi:hypothetical protein